MNSAESGSGQQREDNKEVLVKKARAIFEGGVYLPSLRRELTRGETAEAIVEMQNGEPTKILKYLQDLRESFEDIAGALDLPLNNEQGKAGEAANEKLDTITELIAAIQSEYPTP